MTKDMTVGSPMKNIVKFCLPLMLGNLFQQFYNMADMVIVGRFVGTTALSAVGAVGSLNFLVIGSIIGLCSGLAIPVAQAFGAHDEQRLKKYVANIIYTSVSLAVVLTVAAVSCTNILLKILNIPDDIYKEAYSYIVVIFAGISATVLYNLLAGLVRALGDSRTPLYFLIFSSFLNIGLDLLFVIVFKMGVMGAAVATVAAQAVSGVLCFVLVKKHFPVLTPTKETMGVDFSCISFLLKNGLPMALQFSITGLGSVLLSSCVNPLGSDVIAGMTIGNKTQLIIVLPSETIGITMATYCGQNLGARKPERIKKGIWQAILLSMIYAVAAVFITRYFGKYISMLFVSGEETTVLGLAQQFLDVCSWFYPILSLIFVLRNSLQGLGYSITAMSAGIFELAARSIGGFGFVNRLGFDAACFVNPAAWTAADVLLIPATVIAMRRIMKKLKTEEK